MPLVINGEVIDDAILDHEFSGIKSYFESLGNVSCCERNDEFRGYARQNIVARVLLAQEAMRAAEPIADAELDEALEKLKQEHGGEQRFLSAMGGSTDQMHLIRRDLELNLRVRRLVDNLVAADAPPTEDQLRAFYTDHLDAYKTPEQVRASHILKSPARGEQRAAVYEELRGVRERLMAGGDFDELATQHSDKASEHIDLGFFKRGELAEEFELVAFSMQIGEISPVFVSPFGFHLIKLTGRNPATPIPFEEIRAQVGEAYVEDRRQHHTRLLVERLQVSAVIEDGTTLPTPEHAHAHAT